MTGANHDGPFLPAGPYRLAGGYGRRAFLLGWMLRGFGLMFFALVAWLAAQRVPQLRHDARIWDAADAVEVPAQFDGRFESRFGLLPRYQGMVRFFDRDGRAHEGAVEFETLWQVDRSGESLARYRPADPDAFVYCWAGENLGARWAVVLLMLGGLGGFVAPVCWFLGSRWLRQCRLAKAIAEDGVESSAKLLEVQEHTQYGRLVQRVVRVELATPDGPKKHGEVFARKQGLPCLCAPGRVLVLVSPRFPGRCVVLREDLWPLELPAGQEQRALDRLAAALDVADGTGVDGSAGNARDAAS